MTGAAAARWARVASPVTAWSLAGLTVAIILATVVLTVLTGNLGVSSDGSVIALALVFLAVGFLIAVRQPRNPMGWVLMSTGLATGFTIAAGLYELYSLQLGGAGLPGWRAVIFAENAFWPLGMLIGMTALLLFPDGQLSRPWRRVLWAYAGAGACVLASQAIPGAYLASWPHLHLGAAGEIVGPQATGVLHFLATGLPVLVLVPFWLAWIVRLASRFRGSAGDARQQYKWFTLGAAITFLGLIVMTVAESVASSSALISVVNVTATYAVIAAPLGIGLAILRYRLYEIDRIISRTLAYALVTGLLVGLYAGLVLLATEVLRFSSPVAVAAATLAAAALLRPASRRVQAGLDRRFNRAHYDAEQTVALFSARLKDAVNLDTVRADLLAEVQRSLEPAHVSVWLAGTGPAGHGPGAGPGRPGVDPG